MAEGLLKALPELGRRVERLLYFGSVLLLICFLELYFVSAAKYVKTESTESLAVLLEELEKNQPSLVRLYENPPQPKVAIAQNQREKDIASLRSQLGIPPKVQVATAKLETYAEALFDLVRTSGTSRKVSEETLSILKNANKKPSEIAVDLRKRQQEILLKPVTIWGIETPQVIPMQYAGALYQVPASFVAHALFFALFPLVLGWMASLYVTRQRELMILRSLRDYRVAFPHVLNFFAVDFSRIEPFAGFEKKSRKTRLSLEAQARVLTTLLRSGVLLVFTVPMLFILGYSLFNLFGDTDSLTVMLFALFAFVWLLIQAVWLVVQEWILLWKKEFIVQ